MKSRILSALAVMLVVALPAAARAPIAVLEDGREVDASFITLPSATGGLLAVGCPSCPGKRYRLASEATFFIGKEQVTLGDLRAYLASNPEKAVLLVSPRGEEVVTQIKAQR